MVIHSILRATNPIEKTNSNQNVSEMILNWNTSQNDKLFILGNNGCGKSNLLIDRLYNLLQSGLKPNQILVLSMTNNSVNNLRQIWFNKYARSNFLSLNDLNFYTFNKFVQKIANLNNTNNPYKLIFNNDIDRWLNLFELAQFDFNNDSCINKQDFLNNLIDIYVNKNNHLNNKTALQPNTIENRKNLQTALNKLGFLNLDTMLDRATDFVSHNKNSNFINDFNIILLDDFNDLYSTKWIKFIFGLAQDKQLFLFGDMHQNIYKFYNKRNYTHNSNTTTLTDKYKEISAFVENEKIMKCSLKATNMRNSPEIINWAHNLIHPIPTQSKDSTIFQTKKSLSQIPPQIINFDNKQDQYSFILNEITMLVSTGQVKLKDIAILADKNHIIDDLINHMSNYNIPINKISAQPTWAMDPSIKFIINLWDILYSLESQQPKHMDYNLIEFFKRINGIGMKTIIDFYNKSLSNQTTIWQYLVDKHNSLSKKILNKTRIHKLIDLLRENLILFQKLEHIDNVHTLFKVTENLMNQIPTNVCHFDDDEQLQKFRANLKSLYKFMSNCELVKPRDTNLLQFFLDHYHDQNINDNAFLHDKAQDRNTTLQALQLSTIHSAKGLEYPITFIIDEPAQEKKNDFPIDSNLLYVGATRARNLLYLININHPNTHKNNISSKNGVSASRFIESEQFWSYYNKDLSRVSNFNRENFHSTYKSLAQKYQLKQVRHLHSYIKHIKSFIH